MTETTLFEPEPEGRGAPHRRRPRGYCPKPSQLRLFDVDARTERRTQYVDWLHSPGWQAMRQSVLAWYRHRCQGCDRWAHDVHHLTYIRFGGKEHFYDLLPLCRDCHDELHHAQSR